MSTIKPQGVNALHLCNRHNPRLRGDGVCGLLVFVNRESGIPPGGHVVNRVWVLDAERSGHCGAEFQAEGYTSKLEPLFGPSREI